MELPASYVHLDVLAWLTTSEVPLELPLVVLHLTLLRIPLMLPALLLLADLVEKPSLITFLGDV
jgi:hypothetical protein